MRIELMNTDLSLNVLAMCDSRSSISFVVKTVVPKLQLHGGKASSLVAVLDG